MALEAFRRDVVGSAVFLCIVRGLSVQGLLSVCKRRWVAWCEPWFYERLSPEEPA